MFLFLVIFPIFYYLLYNVLGLQPAKNILSCGIFGFSGKESGDPIKLRWLAYENELRGKDSTGLYTVKANKESSRNIYKTLLKSSEAILNNEFNEALKNSRIVIGHTRAATVGKVEKENAHPFIFEKGFLDKEQRIELTETVVGVHNGFVLDIMAKKFGLEPFKVDSELIFAMLARWGGDYNVLSQIEGAITTAYSVPEKYPDIVHLYRRKARELHLARTREGIYFSSEKKPLELIGCKEILEIPDNCIVLLKDGEIFDYQQVAPPKLKSIPLNASRFNYMDTLPESEFDDYPELKPVKYKTNVFGKHTRQLNLPMSNMERLSEKDENYLKSILDDIKADLLIFEPEPIPMYTMSDAYEDGDIDSCIVVLKLVNSVDKTPLIGFVISDSEKDSITGITGINGVAAIKYSKLLANNNKKLIIADPVDGVSTWIYDLQTSGGKVIELVLEIPLGKVKKKESPHIKTLYYKNTTRMGTDITLLNCVYHLLSLTILGVFSVLTTIISTQYLSRKNRYIHDLRNNKFLETRDQKSVRLFLYNKLQEEKNLIFQHCIIQ